MNNKLKNVIRINPGRPQNCQGLFFLSARISISLTFIVLLELIAEFQFKFAGEAKKRETRDRRTRERREEAILCVMEGQLTIYDNLLIASGRRAFPVSVFFCDATHGVDAM